MADALNIETVVDDLSKPENKKELEKSLNDAFKEATTTSAEDKTAAPDEGEHKDAKKEETAPAGDLSKQKAGEADEKKNRVETLLADRNAAKTEAANAQTEVQVLTKQVEKLTELLTKKSAGEDGERAGDDAGTDDKPLTKKDVAALLEETLNKKASASEQQAAAEKSITDQIQALDTNKETPNAKEYSDNLKAIMAKHSTISAYAAYRMLQGEGIIPINGVNRSNANRTGTGTRSKTTLLDNKNPDNMTQAERLAYLKGAEKSGELAGKV